MENFTPVSALTGGALIGLSAALFLLFNGRLAGISGIMKGILITHGNHVAWRLWFISGLILGPAVYSQLHPDWFIQRSDYPLWMLLGGGFLIGFGTSMGNGCTSGHGVCGIARLSIRSITATVIFMLSGIITVFLIRHAFT